MGEVRELVVSAIDERLRSVWCRGNSDDIFFVVEQVSQSLLSKLIITATLTLLAHFKPGPTPSSSSVRATFTLSRPISLADFELASSLLPDDSADMRAYLVGILSPHCNVVQASDGEQALERALETRIDLLISDVSMPRMVRRTTKRVAEKAFDDKQTSLSLWD